MVESNSENSEKVTAKIFRTDLDVLNDIKVGMGQAGLSNADIIKGALALKLKAVQKRKAARR